QLVLRGLEGAGELVHEATLGRQLTERIDTHEGLNAAVRCTDRRLARQRDQADLARTTDVRTTAQLARPGATDVDHANRRTVLLAKQRHGARGLRVVKAHDAGRDLEVVRNRVVRDLFD